MPRVSVIIPTYNRAHLIGETLESVLSQTYRDFEVIVVDDGSTDDTIPVLSRYGNRIRVISQSHQGQAGSYARNTGIREASGEYIAFLDSDDLWLPDKLERQMILFDNEPGLAWTYTDAEAFDHDTGRLIYRQSKNHRLYEGDVLEALFIGNFIPSITPILHQVVFSKVGNFWSTPKLTDWDMMLRIAEHYPVKFVPDVLARIRLHRTRITESLSGQYAYHAGLNVIQRALDRNPERLMPLKSRALAQLNLTTGRMLARNGYQTQARKMFAQAIRLSPTNIALYFYWLGTSLGKPMLETGINLRRWVRYRRSLK